MPSVSVGADVALLQEHKEHRGNKAAEGYEVVPLQGLSTEEDDSEEGKDGDGDNLLYHLKLHQGEGTAIAYKTDTIGRHLTGILEEGQKPTDEDDDVERCVV